MLHMRNAFAHNQYDTIAISKDGGEIAIESIKGSGVLETRPIKETYRSFFESYSKSREILDQMEKALFNK